MNRGKSTLFSLISVFLMLILASNAISAPSLCNNAMNCPDIHSMQDIEVLGLKPSTTSPEYGDTVMFKFAIKNNGRLPAEFIVSFIPNYVEKPTNPSPSISMFPSLDPDMFVKPPALSKKVKIAAGATLTDVFTYAYTDNYPSVVTPVIIADFNNDISETDEGNNVASASITLRGGAPEPFDDCEDHTPQETLTYNQIGCMNDVVDEHNLHDDALEFCDADIFAQMPEFECYSEVELAYISYQCMLDLFPVIDEELNQCIDGGNSNFRRPDFTAKVEPLLDPLNPEIFIGDKVPFRVTIENIALPVLTTDFSITFDDGTPSEMHNVFFEMSRTYSTVIEHKFAEPGVHTAKVFADPMDLQNEYDEENNIGTASVTVLEGEQPEHPIDILNVVMQPADSFEAGTWAGPDVKIKDVADYDVDDVQVIFSIPALNAAMDYITDMAAGETKTVPHDMLDMMILEDTPPGQYDAKVIVQQHNNLDWAAEWPFTITVLDPSQDDPALPHAVLDVTPLNGTAPLDVTIDGSGSFDSDGEIVKHTLMIEGPNDYFYALLDVDGVPGVVEKTFTDAGEYHIQLIVEDNEAGGAIADEYVTVNAVDDGSNDDSGDGSNEDNNDDNNDGNDNNDNNDNNNSDGNDAGPSILDRTVKEITQDSATITWTTNVDADARVEYGTDKEDLGDHESDNSFETSHSIDISDLESDTKYYYTIKSCDEDDHCTEKGPYSFTTDVDDTSGYSGDDTLDSTWDDLYAQNTALFNGQDSGSDEADVSDDSSAVVVTSSPSASEVEVVFTPIQYMEVEEEVCGFKFLWWCLWKDMVTRQIPVPSMSGGMQFFV